MLSTSLNQFSTRQRFHQFQNYTEVIRNPMDLKTIQNRLCQHPGESGVSPYRRPQQFLEDLQLIVSNSRLFNCDSDTQVS